MTENGPSAAEEVLQKAGMHVDDLNRLRLLAPEVADNCTEFHTECKEFTQQLGSFKTTTGSLIQTLEELAQLVETEKLQAMASRSALKNADKQKVAEKQQLQIQMRERQIELERVRAELEAAQRVEAEQRDYLQQFISS